jgi:hypothetical protein
VKASTQPRRLPGAAKSGIEDYPPRRTGLMRLIFVVCLLSLAGCVGSAREEGFAVTGPNGFLYSAHTNTVMTENDDGVAERLRRDWLADAVRSHGICTNGYVVDTRRFVPDANGIFGNGGEILYTGRCLLERAPPVIEQQTVPVRG